VVGIRGQRSRQLDGPSAAAAADSRASLGPGRLTVVDHLRFVDKFVRWNLPRSCRAGWECKTDPRLMEALQTVPRRPFAPLLPRLWRFIRLIPKGPAVMSPYSHDSAVPIGRGSTLSRWSVQADMSALLDVQPHHRVLEIGTGSGYQAAILGKLASEGEVHTVESEPVVARRAKRRLARRRHSNVHVHVQDGRNGLPDHGPFDRILVTAGATRDVISTLIGQLAEGGRLVAPPRWNYDLMQVDIRDGKQVVKMIDAEVHFMPLSDPAKRVGASTRYV
jgi:protein-L-isoaspartate(D-aspartate) O-methyltransferase